MHGLSTARRGKNKIPKELRGRSRPALERFAEKCAFDPVTGCVMWIGTTTAGHGHNEPYGRFWFEGMFWLAHRWAAVHIHGQEIGGLQVDHCCPAGPSTLCVQHLKPETSEVNRELQHTRPGRAFQDLRTKQYWLLVSIGAEPFEAKARELDGVPFFNPPAWLAPFLTKPESSDACPF
jgi:hypothetical protein